MNILQFNEKDIAGSYRQFSVDAEFVVYTADFGNYSGVENIINAAKKCPEIQFLCFSDLDVNSTLKNLCSIKVRVELGSHRQVAKYFKILPNRILPNPIVNSLWMDANLSINPIGLRLLKKAIEAREGIYLYRHDKRKNVHEEVQDVLRYGKETRANCDKIRSFLFNSNSSKGSIANSLYQGRIIGRNAGNSDSVTQFNECWWAMIEKYSYRDQLSLPLAAETAQVELRLIDDVLARHELCAINLHNRHKFEFKNGSARDFINYRKAQLLFYLARLRGWIGSK